MSLREVVIALQGKTIESKIVLITTLASLSGRNTNRKLYLADIQSKILIPSQIFQNSIIAWV